MITKAHNVKARERKRRKKWEQNGRDGIKATSRG
jgi:hypothetical protein